MDNPVEIPCPICGGSTEVEYASTGTSIECIDGDGCHALTVMPCFPEEAERCIRAWAGRASQDNGGKQLVSSAWLDALAVRWERRIAFLENGCSCDPQSYHRGLIDAHGDCLKDLRSEMESASNGRAERRKAGDQ